MTRRNVAGIAIVLLLVLTMAAPVLAQGPVFSTADKRCTGPSGEAMIVDLVVLRPAGLIASGIGAIFGIASFPVAVMTNSVDRYDQKFFREPLEYTFPRPVGDNDFFCDEEMAIRY
ncbi:MAG TPA: hypothetical protein DEO88_00885 [Syntrophobacteraceae bacterium]|jgi:hypothetical protein|nr:hypothetical protein [Syntrophobacteraceae bacterium]